MEMQEALPLPGINGSQAFALDARPLQPFDMEKVMCLVKWMHSESIYKDRPLNEGRTEHILRALIVHTSPLAAGVFDRGGDLAGFIFAETLDDPWTDMKVALDHGFYVAPAYRGTEAGRMLLERLEIWADQQGATYTRLSVFAGIDNKRAGKFLERAGYRQGGTIHVKGI